MPTIPTSDIFPSVKLLSTDASGDLQEVSSAPPAKASKTFFTGDMKLEANEGGVEGNAVSLTITDNSQFGADVCRVENDNDIVVELTKPLTALDAGIADALIYNGYVTLTAKNNGDSNIQLNIIDDVDNGFAVVGSEASGTLAGVKLDAVNVGVTGGNITLTIIDDGGAGVVANTVSVAGTDITINLADLGVNQDTTQDIEDLINNDPTASGLVLASNGDATVASTLAQSAISTATDFVAGVDAVNDKDVVKIAASDSDINVCLHQDIVNYTNNDIRQLLIDTSTAWYSSLDALVSVTVTNAGASGNAAVTGTFDFTGGADPANQSNTIDDVINLINSNEEASALVTASLENAGNGGNLPQLVTLTNLANGKAAIVADLEPSSDFVCIKIDDIHSFKSDEINDGRKLFWGVLESYTQVASGLSAESQPENLLVTRGNPTLVIDQAGTRIRQVYSVQSFYATGDFDLEDETSV